MAGWPDGRMAGRGMAGRGMALELVHDKAAPVQSRPTEEDFLVLYLGEAALDNLAARLERHGGRRVLARNPYRDTRVVTIENPDRCRLGSVGPELVQRLRRGPRWPMPQGRA